MVGSRHQKQGIPCTRLNEPTMSRGFRIYSVGCAAGRHHQIVVLHCLCHATLFPLITSTNRRCASCKTMSRTFATTNHLPFQTLLDILHLKEPQRPFTDVAGNHGHLWDQRGHCRFGRGDVALHKKQRSAGQYGGDHTSNFYPGSGCREA